MIRAQNARARLRAHNRRRIDVRTLYCALTLYGLKSATATATATTTTTSTGMSAHTCVYVCVRARPPSRWHLSPARARAFGVCAARQRAEAAKRRMEDTYLYLFVYIFMPGKLAAAAVAAVVRAWKCAHVMHFKAARLISGRRRLSPGDDGDDDDTSLALSARNSASACTQTHTHVRSQYI